MLRWAIIQESELDQVRKYTYHHHVSTHSLADLTPLGPIRHPRPLTAAELHLELEKEQESIVSI